MPPSSNAAATAAAADTLIRGRTKRSNAGNRMRELLDQEIEVEEVFQEVEGDIDFQEKQDEEDIVDSDFGKSSDEEAGAEDSEEEGERQLQAEEKAARKASRTKAVAPHMRKPAIRTPKASTSTAAGTSADGARPARSTTKKRASFAPSALLSPNAAGDASRSLRRSTQATSASVSAKIAAQEARRQAATPRVRAPKRAKLTQDALIAEALETEERNRESLRLFLDREEERKAKDRRGGKKEITGPFLSWRSVGVETGRRMVREMTEGTNSQQATPAPQGQGDLLVDPVMADRAAAALLRERQGEGTSASASAPQPSTASAAAGAATSFETTPALAASSTFTSPDLSMQRQSRTILALRNMPTTSTWADEFRALLGTHSPWEALPLVAARNRPLRPRQSTCAITGAPAIYRDPRTGVPFASAEAYGVLSQVLAHEFTWMQERAAREEEGWRMGAYADRREESGAGGCLRDARERAGVRKELPPTQTQLALLEAPAPKRTAPPVAMPVPAQPSAPVHAQVAPGWVMAPSFEVAPGDEKAIVAAALALPSGTTRSGGRRSAAADAAGEK